MSYVVFDKECEKYREKSSIAWFKLAEVITRGEKERVLTIYRLLIHSLSNEPLKILLEAEILRLFGDQNALLCYIKAAQMYSNNNELAQAIFLYKIIITLAPENHDYKATLLTLQNALREESLCDTVHVCQPSTQTARVIHY